MQLTRLRLRQSGLRHPGLCLAALIAATVAAATFVEGDAAAQAPNQPPNPEDVLKSFVVEAEAAAKPLPKIGIKPSLSSDDADITLHSVMRRDLDLSGEFRVMADKNAPEGAYESDSVDVKAWRAKGAEAVVQVIGKTVAGGKMSLTGLAYFTNAGDKPVFKKTVSVPAAGARQASHQMADALVGALTGTNGSFDSQMTFIYGVGKKRRVYVIDADGHHPRAVSSNDQLALTPAFGPGQQLHYAASVKHDAFKVFTPGTPLPLTFAPTGSVYGIAFSRKRDEVALSIADGPFIRLFRGPDFQQLKLINSNTMALHPAFSPNGKLAYSGKGRWGQQIFIGDKPVSPAGIGAYAPVFCRHPNGVRLIYAVGVGKDTDLVASGENGGSMVRLTQSQGRNNYPACSPDGRLIAFFSTRKSGEGPGLYIMRIDGMRPKRISTLHGDSLRWARNPKPPKK
jgi:TolB protein